MLVSCAFDILVELVAVTLCLSNSYCSSNQFVTGNVINLTKPHNCTLKEGNHLEKVVTAMMIFIIAPRSALSFTAPFTPVVTRVCGFGTREDVILQDFSNRQSVANEKVEADLVDSPIIGTS